jgi:hypothetical protein
VFWGDQGTDPANLLSEQGSGSVIDTSPSTQSPHSLIAKSIATQLFYFAMPAKCKERERLLASGNNDVPALPLGAVRGLLCFRCFEPAKQILKCAACRRAGYCSQECQKLDWTVIHKKQCKFLRQINELDLKDYSDSRTWAEYRRSLVDKS